MNARLISARVVHGVGTFCVLGAALVASSGCATGHRERLLTEQDRQLNVESFDYVWKTIRDTHFDAELGGLDWDGIRDELRPKVQDARTMSTARSAMRDMISRLEQTHFGIIPSEAYDSMEEAEDSENAGGDDEDSSEDAEKKDSPKDGSTGMEVRVVDGRALVTTVAEGSPAAKLGVKTGWIIERIADRDVTPIIERVSEAYADKTLKDLVLSRAVTGRMGGHVGDEVVVQFLDKDDRHVELSLTLATMPGRRFQFGNLPPMYVNTVTRLIDGNVGYFALDGFWDPAGVMKEFGSAMRSFMDADGVIVDIRGNGGGIGGMSMGMAGWFVSSKNERLGTTYMRNMNLKFVVNRRAKTFTGPLVILVDGLSASTSEIFAGGLKDIGRACVIGTRTAGAALPSKIEKLPNGDGFQYAFANYVSAGGEELEGKGVTPDIEARPTREALLAGRDLAMEAALAWIRKPK